MIFYTYRQNAISYNVPVVTDVFVARISETVGFAGLQKCGGAKRHKGVARLQFFVIE
jgi:hypothetical protein